MASVLKVDKLDPQSGTALEIGTSGDTISVPSGATLDISASTLTPPATMPASSGANLTSLTSGNLTGALPAISGASLTGIDIGNYSFHAMAEYDETTYYDLTASTNGGAITDESCSLTPTSTSDIFICTCSLTVYTDTASNGFGISLRYATVADFSSNTDIYNVGRYSEMSPWTSFYGQQSCTAKVTGLAADTLHYFRMYGMCHRPSSGTVRYNNDAYATMGNARHGVQVIQYRYNG
jgi:hypothetical protein